MEVQPMDKEDAAREKGIYHVTVVGSGVNFLLLLFKFFAGIVGHSAAMLADAVHSLSDFVTDIIVIVFVRISSKPEDEGHDYGHGKYETLATAIIGIVLLFVGFGIFWNGALSIYHFLHGGSLQEPGMLALIAALVSIVFKEALYRYTVFKGKKLNSQAVVANAWHHRSDALSSIGTAVGIGGAILLGNHWRVLDPIAAVVVSFFIMKAILQAYALIECLERDVLDERDPVYLYVINLCAELYRFYLLAPYDRAYVMTVNTDNTVTDPPAFKEFLFLYKDLSDDGKPLLIILCICE